MNTFWGVRIFIWLFFLTSVGLFLGVVIYFFRKKINEKYLKLRWPELVVRVIIHHPGSQFFQEFWRLIPDREDFKLEGKTYLYSAAAVLKENKSYAYSKDDKLVIKVEDKEYNLEGNYKIKRRWDRWAEIHYLYNIPNPIDFINSREVDTEGKPVIKFTAKELESLKENDLFQKLLTLSMEKGLLIFCLLLGAANFIASMFIISKVMGWLK